MPRSYKQMRKWTDAKLEKEAAFAPPANDGGPDCLAWNAAIHAEYVRRGKVPPDGLVPVYFECGICGHCHPWAFNGDCRDDTNRFTNAELDDKHGQDKWECRTMDERVAADLTR